jgi:membrane-associated protease RseP (regulator of RpoE activity)
MNGSRGLLAVLMRARVAILIVAVIAAVIVFSGSHRAFLLGVVIFVLALLISVMLHEFGHFLTAKKFGMRVTQFFLGFGTTLWSFFRGETEYGVKALPFGGFVKITGMTSMDEIDVADEPRSFRNQPGWQRMIVLAAGSFMHFVLALFLLFVLALGIGMPSDNTNLVAGITTCVPVSNTVLGSTSPCTGASKAKSPADQAGLQPNDRIVSLAGHPVSNFNQLHNVLAKEPVGVPLPMVAQSQSGQRRSLTITLVHVRGRSVPYLGIDVATIYLPQGFWGSVKFSGAEFWDTVTGSVAAVGHLPAAIPDLFSKNRANTPAGDVSSVVGVANVTGDVTEAAIAWQAKATLILLLIASLNIFVGIFNLLPLLPLDGGHLAVVIYERIRAWFARLRGLPEPGLVDIQKLVPVSLLVFAVLIGFGTLLIAADIFNPVHVNV